MKAVLIFLLLAFASNLGLAQQAERDLNKNVLFIVEAKIKPGQFDQFVSVATAMSKTVKEKEAGALTYEWTISADSTMCYILERYANSEAAMNHVKIFREEFAAKFGSVLEMTGFSLYGKADDQLKEALGTERNSSRVKVAGFAR